MLAAIWVGSDPADVMRSESCSNIVGQPIAAMLSAWGIAIPALLKRSMAPSATDRSEQRTAVGFASRGNTT